MLTAAAAAAAADLNEQGASPLIQSIESSQSLNGGEGGGFPSGGQQAGAVSLGAAAVLLVTL